MFKSTLIKRLCFLTTLALAFGLWGQPAGATSKRRSLRPVDKAARFMLSQALIKANFKQPENVIGGLQTIGVTAKSGWSYVYRFWNPQTAVGKDVSQLARELGHPYQRISISPTGKVIRDVYRLHVRTKLAQTKSGRSVLDLTFRDKSVNYIMPVTVRYEPATGLAAITERWRPVGQPQNVQTSTRTIEIKKELTPGYELFTALHDKLWVLRPVHIDGVSVNGFPSK